jgi:hypothetical protein
MSAQSFSGFRFRLSLWKFLRLCAGPMFLLGVVFCAPAARAQYDTATVVGTVTDPGGAVVAGADVQLKNIQQGTVLTRKSNRTGNYEFPDVQIGTYTVTVNAPGFAESTTSPFELTVSARQKVDVPLKVGSTSENVTVTLDNTGLQTESGEQSTTIENEKIIDLPLNGREYTDLALLTPGVQVGSLQNGTVDQRRGSFYSNDQRSSVNNFLLDGLDNNSYQVVNQGLNNQAVTESVDAVQQYVVITSNYPAEYGRAGGAIVNVKTKSGTDTPHGTLFEYLRDTIFDASGPFAGTTGLQPTLVQNQFGGSFGYSFPKVKDFFYFIDYEGFRQSTNSVEAATLPTVNQRNGTFTAPSSATATNPTYIPVPLMNPLTGKQYPTGVIPAGDITPFAAAVLAALPQPTINAQPGTGANYVTLQPGHNYRDIFDLRVDKYFGNRLQTFARFSKQSIHIAEPDEFSGPAGGDGAGHVRVLVSSGVAGATYVVTPNSLLDVRVGVTYSNSGHVPYNQGLPDFYAPLNIPYPVSPSIQSAGLNTQAVLDFSEFGVEDTNDQFSNPNTYNVKANYTLAKGRHSFSFGYEWLHLDEKVDPGTPLLGEDTYEGEFSAASPAGVTKPPSTVARRQAYGLADFFFGARDEYQLANYDVATEYYDYHYAYAEDSWKVLPRLTLTYGLRYEFATPERALGQPIVNFDPTANALQVGSTSGSLYQQALVNPKLDDFAPRAGFAYSLYPNIVFRGGYGLSFIQFNRYGTESDLLSNPPYTLDGIVTQAPSQGLCAAGSQSLTCFRPTMQGYPASLISPANFSTTAVATYYIPAHSAPGYAQSYSLGTQVQIDPATVLDIAYVGAHDVHLRVLADYNEAPAQLPLQTASLQARRPVSNFNDIRDSLSAGFLRYNSLQVKVTHREKAGLFLLNSFTFSKGIDNASGSLEEANGDSEFISYRNIKYDNGISGYNQKINDSLGAVWKIPYGAGVSNRVLRASASGWTLTTITRLTTGLPINITYTPDDADLTSNVGNYRPNYTGYTYNLINPRSKWTPSSAGGYQNVLVPLNTVSTNGVGTTLSLPATALQSGTTPYGNLPRNSVVGPSYYNVDLGVQKNFPLPEHGNLQFRVEAFNILNHTNFKTPDPDLSDSTYGDYAPTSASVFPSRQLQFAARYSF